MSLRWSEQSLEHGGLVLHGAISDLANASIMLIWAGGKPKLGTLTATLPEGTSSPLLGDRDEVYAKIIGSRLAGSRGKLALVSVNLPPDWEDGRPLIELAKRLMGEGVE